jgi:hypothetical protein
MDFLRGVRVVSAIQNLLALLLFLLNTVQAENFYTVYRI